jgi:hypothetical protein
MDFEGLGSFERTKQEEMLLSILNFSLSNLTIFNKKVSFEYCLICLDFIVSFSHDIVALDLPLYYYSYSINDPL